MEKLKIDYLPVTALTPYKKNTRKHKELDIKNIKESIERYGFDDPIGIWGEDNTIVEGHGRLMAAKALGMTEVPTIRLDHLTDKQRREYAIAHNATAELSEWDYGLLAAELPDLNFEGFDFNFDVEVISPDEFSEEFSLPDGEKSQAYKMAITLHKEQRALIDYAITTVESYITETFGNTDKKGNAIYEIIRQWAESKEGDKC